MHLYETTVLKCELKQMKGKRFCEKTRKMVYLFVFLPDQMFNRQFLIFRSQSFLYFFYFHFVLFVWREFCLLLASLHLSLSAQLDVIWQLMHSWKCSTCMFLQKMKFLQIINLTESEFFCVALKYSIYNYFYC